MTSHKGLLLKELFKVVMDNYKLQDPTFSIPKCGVSFTPDIFFHFFRYSSEKWENEDTVTPFEPLEKLQLISCAFVKPSAYSNVSVSLLLNTDHRSLYHKKVEKLLVQKGLHYYKAEDLLRELHYVV